MQIPYVTFKLRFRSFSGSFQLLTFPFSVPSALCLSSPVFFSDGAQLLLEEQRFSMQVAQRKLGQKVRLYLLRFILNVFVLSLLGGAFYLIYFAIRAHVNGVSQ